MEHKNIIVQMAGQENMFGQNLEVILVLLEDLVQMYMHLGH